MVVTPSELPLFYYFCVAMFVVIILILSLLVVLADWVAYRKYVATSGCIYWRWGVAVFFVASNLLPYIAMMKMWLTDGSSMKSIMWLLTLYTLLSLMRVALYIGILLINNRYAKWVVGLSFCTIVACVMVVGVVHTRKALTVKSIEISSERLPQSFDGYRIAFFSDLHIGTMPSVVAMCRKIAEYVNLLDADLVVFGGDLINVRYDELTRRLQTILGEIEARDGVVAVLGNHDTGVYVRDTVALPIEENTRLLVERMKAMGWRVMNDESELIVRGDDTITLTGVGFSRELLKHRHSANVADSLDLQPVYEGVSRERFNITISHMPQLWRKIAALGYGDLVLSGHTHAMQMKGCIGDYKFSPAQFMYREWSGLYKEDSSHLYITDGVGNVGFHLRIGAPPEVTLLTLRCNSD